MTMRNAIPKLFLTGMLIVPFLLWAQDPYTFSNDPYSGINAAGISPTQPYFNPNKWDVNLVAEDVFVQNNYGYISKTNLISLIWNDTQEADLANNITGENTKRVFDFFNNQKINYHVSSDLMGPSGSVRFTLGDNNYSAGIFTRLRTQSSGINIDNYLQFNDQGLVEPEYFDLNPFTVNFMNWTEIGLNLATEIPSRSDYKWIAGVNIKYLMGNDAFVADNNTHADLTRIYELDSETNSDVKNLYASNFDVGISYATSYNFDTDSYEYKPQGTGIGFDLGLSMVQGESDEFYDLKLSANILDLGVVNFNKGYVHSFIGDNFLYNNNANIDNLEFESIEQSLQVISNELYGNPNQSLIDNTFKIGLPTSVHLNASKRITENGFVNLNLVQRAPIFENSLKRSNIFNASYLFSKKMWGYGASISTYEYSNVMMGGYFRIGPLVLGSENILPIFIPHAKVRGADFYVALRIYPFGNNSRSGKDCNCDYLK